MPTSAASFEGLLVIVVIMAISALSSWIKRKQEGQAGGEGGWGDALDRDLPAKPGEPRPASRPGAPPPLAPGQRTPPPTPPARPATFGDWEEQLRRLLEGDPAPSPPPAPVPVPSPSPASAPPRPKPPAAPPPLVATAAADEDEDTIAPMPLPAGTHFPAATTRSLDQQEAPSFELAGMTESTSAIQRGLRIQERVAARLRAVHTRAATPRATAPVQRRSTLAPEVAQLSARLSRPETARQAVVASLILGPPKAFDA